MSEVLKETESVFIERIPGCDVLNHLRNMRSIAEITGKLVVSQIGSSSVEVEPGGVPVVR